MNYTVFTILNDFGYEGTELIFATTSEQTANEWLINNREILYDPYMLKWTPSGDCVRVEIKVQK